MMNCQIKPAGTKRSCQDAFHDRWFQHRLVVEHQMRKQQGALKDQSVQAGCRLLGYFKHWILSTNLEFWT